MTFDLLFFINSILFGIALAMDAFSVSVANAFKEDEKRAISEGMNGHIAKPIDIGRLFEMLAETISVKD